MGWTRIAHGSAGASAGNHKTVSVTVDSSGGDLIVMGGAWYPNAGVNGTFSSNKAGTVSLTNVIAVTDSRAVRLAFMAAPTVGSGHVLTLDHLTSDIYPGLSVEVWAGSHASPLDQQNGASSASASSLAPGSITPTQDGELIFAVLMNENNSGGARSINGGFTLGDGTAYNAGASEGVHIAYLEQTSAVAANPTWSITNAAALAVKIVSFKAAVVAAGQPTMRRWAGVPHMGGRSLGSRHGKSGRSFGRTNSGLYVPNHLREVA